MSDDYKLARYDIRMPGGALAYTRGQVVRVDAVKANGWDEFVVGRDTQEARSILAEITGDPIEEPKASSTRRAASSSTTSDTASATTTSETE